jgi:outer membrane protein OmpA-like peptidoglycan-associated protein
MSDTAEDAPKTEDDLTGGLAAAHPEPDIQPMLVAPTLEVAVNTIRAFLIPVGCWRLDDLRFDFDSSFVRASAKKEMRMLAKLVKEHPGSPLTIFGSHCFFCASVPNVRM